MFAKEKTPDQIRRETVPVKHTGLIYGFLGGVFCVGLWFGGWGLFHQEQVRRYPEYVVSSVKANTNGLSFSFFGRRPSPERGMNADQLRYALMRYGNLDHVFDAEIIRHGWYPRGAHPTRWVHENGGVRPLYADSPVTIFKWPLTVSLLTFLGALIWGMIADYRYRCSIIAGVPFDGSVVATVSDYKKEVKGDGMKYRVKAWSDR